MNILIKSAKIIDKSSSHNGKKKDILIENGVIKTIGTNINSKKDTKIISSQNLHVSIGWFDMQADFCDPGFEFKEDLVSGSQAAANGGFTGVCVVPSTNPSISTKAEIEYIKTKTKGGIVDIYPIGSLSEKRKGENISEMFDMHKAGAVAFSDDKMPVNNAGLLTRALLYVQNFNSLIIAHCDDKSISNEGVINEGVVSTTTGLKGIPGLAEEVMVARNIFLAEYTNSPIHLANISTKKSVELIKEAKSKGIKVTASTNAYNLTTDEGVLEDFDSNYKVKPPLRTKEDIKALQTGVANGTIDVITTDHRPQHMESKELEFDNASNGMIGLESCFGLINTYKGRLKLDKIIEALSNNPRRILNHNTPRIEEKEKVNLTLFDPELKWTFKADSIKSKSKNSPFIGNTFTGKVLGIINNKKQHFNK